MISYFKSCKLGKGIPSKVRGGYPPEVREAEAPESKGRDPLRLGKGIPPKARERDHLKLV